jgi:hypothetical protein
MKKVVVLVIGIIVLVGCGVFKNNSVKHAPKTDFNVSQDVVLYKGKPFAKLQAITWSLDGGELVKEFNFHLVDTKDLSIIGGMIDYLSDRHQGDEIEVEFNIENGSNEFKL